MASICSKDSVPGTKGSPPTMRRRKQVTAPGFGWGGEAAIFASLALVPGAGEYFGFLTSGSSAPGDQKTGFWL